MEKLIYPNDNKLFWLLIVLGLAGCENEEGLASPQVLLSADKSVLCAGEALAVTISSPDTNLDLSLVTLQQSPAIGELNNRTFSAPAEVFEKQFISIQAYYDGRLLENAELPLVIDGSSKETFVKRYELYDTKTFHNMDLLSLPDGNLLAASGERQSDLQFRMTKLDTDGRQLWVKSFGEGSCEVVKLYNNNIIAGGLAYEGFETSLVVYKVDLQGNQFGALPLGKAYALLDMEITPAGEILLAVSPEEAAQQTRLMKVTSCGHIIWEKELAGVLTKDLMLTSDQQIAMTYLANNKAKLRLMSRAGEQLWDKDLGTEQACLPIKTADDGRIVVAAQAIINNRRAFGLQGYDINGQQLFKRQYTPSETGQEDLIFDLKKVNDGFIISGMSILNGTGQQYLRKTNSSGVPFWEWSYGNEQIQGFAHTIATLEDDVFVWGALEDRSCEGPTAYNSLVRLDGDGTLSPCQQEGF